MKLHELPQFKGKNKKARQVGRGLGSTKGKTSGSGIKGQKARNRLKLHRLQVFKRFPMLRGKLNRRKEWAEQPQTVALGACNIFRKGSRVDIHSLLEHNLIDNPEQPIKVLATGTLEKALIFSSELAFSSNARTQIQAVGGTID